MEKVEKKMEELWGVSYSFPSERPTFSMRFGSSLVFATAGMVVALLIKTSHRTHDGIFQGMNEKEWEQIMGWLRQAI